MGSLVLVQNKSQSVMKVLLLVALVIATVLAEPEADANAPDDKVALYPGIYGFRPGYATVAANPVVGNPGYALRKSYVPYGYGHYLGKREAEATPEASADPEVVAGYGHPYGGYYGGHYGGHYGGYYGGYYGYPSLPKGVTPIGNQFPYWG